VPAVSAVAQPAASPLERSARELPRWWPLAALTLLAAALRLSTLGLQSFWYDEAFTPVHVLHPSLISTLRSVAHTENNPPLWYLVAWLDWRLLGTGEVALRLPSALAGIASVPVAWAIGCELAGRRAAIAGAALVAVSPLFVWYSQEARPYGLFVLTAGLAILTFLRAARPAVVDGGTGGRMAAFALCGALALLTHYFAVFLLVPMALWLLADRRLRRAAAPALAALAVVGAALLPLVLEQGGHGTQWIGRWPLSDRLQAIPQYFLTGPSGDPLGHGIELLVALPLLAAACWGLWRMFDRPAARMGPAAGAQPAPAGSGGTDGPHGPPPETAAAALAAREERGAAMAATLAACGLLIPVALVAFGADYLAPRNLVGGMVALTALLAVLCVTPRAGRAGVALTTAAVVGLLAITIDVDLSPRLQRGNWRDLARVLRRGESPRAITTVELGAAPLQYYMHGLHKLARGSSPLLREIDETGYAPLRASAARPPAAGFRLLSRVDVDGLILYRFGSPVARPVSEAQLARHVITLARPEVLVPRGLRHAP
jgi:hypothetical protein